MVTGDRAEVAETVGAMHRRRRACSPSGRPAEKVRRGPGRSRHGPVDHGRRRHQRRSRAGRSRTSAWRWAPGARPPRRRPPTWCSPSTGSTGSARRRAIARRTRRIALQSVARRHGPVAGGDGRRGGRPAARRVGRAPAGGHRRRGDPQRAAGAAAARGPGACRRADAALTQRFRASTSASAPTSTELRATADCWAHPGGEALTRVRAGPPPARARRSARTSRPRNRSSTRRSAGCSADLRPPRP